MAKAKILQAARPLFESGRQPTVTEIAEAAGVSRATFHRLIGSRTELARQLDVEPPPGSRERIVAAAVVMVGQAGLDALSMDELAAAAGVSRAALYRLFPGKPALFRELVRSYSPMETVGRVMAAAGGRPPEALMPELARAVASEMEGRVGLALGLIGEIQRGNPDVDEALEFAFRNAMAAVLGYVMNQMAEGRLRPMHPVLALQSFIGPVFVHLLMRQLAVDKLAFDLPLEDSVSELALTWVRAMRPGPNV